jgi:3-deoxy-7-phosphoheptulonate synthase
MTIAVKRTALLRSIPAGGSARMVDRANHPDDSVVSIGGVPVGGRRFTVIAGPCAVESIGQVEATAEAVRFYGGHLLRGGAFKPRSSPYTFQGHGLEGLKLLRAASQRTGLPVVSEVLESSEIPQMAPLVDAFQVGARNMQNVPLLRALGRQARPVLLKRGQSATVEELLLAAEFILAGGNFGVVLCERGIRTFEPSTRNTLDLNAVAVLKRDTHLPVIVDPSHGTGRSELVLPLARAAVAVGADGIIVEVHHRPSEALSDGRQSLSPDGFGKLMAGIAPFVAAAGRELA